MRCQALLKNQGGPVSGPPFHYESDCAGEMKTNRFYFMKTDRIGFSEWTECDMELAELLWGDREVSRYICSSGQFSREEIVSRLHTEIRNNIEYHVQYWPIFELQSGRFIGCCGLRPRRPGIYETGFHLKPEFWRKGLASEAATAVIHHAFSNLQAEELFAGHNPKNAASRHLLQKLGFEYIGDEFYEPTGLYHPSYALKPENLIRRSSSKMEG